MSEFWRKVISTFLEGCSLLAFILSIIFTGALATSADPRGDGIACTVGFLFAALLMGLARLVEDE